MRKIIFKGKNFDAIKKGNNYFGIEEKNGNELTSTNTKSSAIKRVKLMDKVYDLGYSQGSYWECY